MSTYTTIKSGFNSGESVSLRVTRSDNYYWNRAAKTWVSTINGYVVFANGSGIATHSDISSGDTWPAGRYKFSYMVSISGVWSVNRTEYYSSTGVSGDPLTLISVYDLTCSDVLIRTDFYNYDFSVYPFIVPISSPELFDFNISGINIISPQTIMADMTVSGINVLAQNPPPDLEISGPTITPIPPWGEEKVRLSLENKEVLLMVDPFKWDYDPKYVTPEKWTQGGSRYSYNRGAKNDHSIEFRKLSKTTLDSIIYFFDAVTLNNTNRFYINHNTIGTRFVRLSRPIEWVKTAAGYTVKINLVEGV